MPNPIEILLDPISLIILAIYAALFIWEALFPGRELEHVPFWKLRGLTAFAVFFYLSTYLPLLVDGYLAQYQLFDMSHLGTLGRHFSWRFVVRVRRIRLAPHATQFRSLVEDLSSNAP